MVSLKALAKKGITEESLKKAFTTDKPSEKVEALRKRIRTRIDDGLQSNFSSFKLYYAIDQAYNAPFRQTTETLMRTLASEPANSELVLSAAAKFSLDHLLTEDIDPKTQKPTGRKRMSVPTFFQVLIPLVLTYVKTRAAKITNDRDQTPYFKFEPLISTPINRARCELLTSRIEAMTTQMGMRDVGRQTILKSLIYSVCLQFLEEEWHKEEQEDDDGESYIIKEGLRYHLPHMTRCYYDISHPLASLHSDNGCDFGGYWRVRRYRDVLVNKDWWNVDRMRLPTGDLRRDNQVFFNTVYPCRMSFPSSLAQWGQLGMDREEKLQNAFYSSVWEDSAVVITEHFEKLIPADDGLGDYEYPVWFRFVTANSDTILYAKPLPACPIIYWGYDPDESRSMNPSLALEVLPFQDLVSNLLTQSILAVKQNLANLVFVDTDVVDEETIETLQNRGERLFREINFCRVSGNKVRKLRNNDSGIKDLIGTVRFPQLNEQGPLNMIQTALALLERCLGISAQEAGGQATHEQSAEESSNIKVATQSRLNYTSSSYDRSFDAWKRQLYAYLMAYGEDEIYAHITANPAYTEKIFTELKATIEETASEHSDMKSLVKLNKAALQGEPLNLEYFASTRDGQERTNQAAMAMAMTQFLSSVLANQMMQQAIGPEQAIQLMNKALEQFGFPRDFKLRAMPGKTPDEQQQWVMQQLQQLTGQVKQFVEQGITQSQQTVLAEVGKALGPMQESLQAVQQAIPQIVQAIPPLQQGVEQAAAGAQQAMVLGHKNELAIAKIAEVLMHQQELHDEKILSMLQINRIPLTPAQIQQVRKWLSQPEAELFRKVLSANVAALQLEAGRLMVAGVMDDTEEEKAARFRAQEALPYLHTLAVLENLTAQDDLFFRAEPEML